ncbi:hypothetical protein PYCCODRAFT_1001584 [Trametes coccinea BRFM310]|uniref:RNI-like protein n=1 Tax=Trametes coccinea (strain BRFM310) TaxID=1353009 RepID=A0A1Y2IDI4_TRAC3|nr:hypothetical protein PYCCODRAFT_1001584 [Trametes coccinea BRFM310]
MLARLAGHNPLLPNLRRLTRFFVDEFSICEVFLLSPTIRELELVIGETVNAGVVRMLMDSVQSTLLTLDHLSIDHAFRRHEMVRVPLVEFWAFSQLQSLKVTQEVYLANDELQALAAFPNLRSLSLNLGLIDDIEPGSITGFAQLRDLELSGELLSITNFMASTPMPLLDSITLSSSILCSGNFASGTRGESTLQCLCTSLPMSIQRLCLSVTCACEGEYRHTSKPSELFEHLRSLTNLRSLRVAFAARMNASKLLPENVLYSLRNAWPELRIFKVGTLIRDIEDREPYEGRRPRIDISDRRRGERGYSAAPERMASRSDTDLLTLSSLAAFAHGHPHLQILEVPVLDLGTLPELDSVPALGHPLREFRVGTHHLYVCAPLFDCALVLDLLFPHLDLCDARTVVEAREGERRDHVLLECILLGLQAGRSGAHWAHAAPLGEYDADTPLPTRSHMHQLGQYHSVHRSPTAVGQSIPPSPIMVPPSPMSSRTSLSRPRTPNPPGRSPERDDGYGDRRRARQRYHSRSPDRGEYYGRRPGAGARARDDGRPRSVFRDVRSEVARVTTPVFELFGLSCFCKFRRG